MNKKLNRFLASRHLSRGRIKRIQRLLNKSGYEAGRVDGIVGTVTTSAIDSYCLDNPEIASKISKALKRRMAPFHDNGKGFSSSRHGLSSAGRVNIKSLRRSDLRFSNRDLSFSPSAPAGRLHPHLSVIMDIKNSRDPRIKTLKGVLGKSWNYRKIKRTQGYIKMTFEAAKKYGLDGAMLANQYWQESKYNPHIGSAKGAKGISQMIPSTGEKYGLIKDRDFYNPRKSIYAGAKLMKHLTRKFGSQGLALAAYNGGEKAVAYGLRGVRDKTQRGWVRRMARIRRRFPGGRKSMWKHETLDYIRKIDSRFWRGKLGKLAGSFVPDGKGGDKKTDYASNAGHVTGQDRTGIRRFLIPDNLGAGRGVNRSFANRIDPDGAVGGVKESGVSAGKLKDAFGKNSPMFGVDGPLPSAESAKKPPALSVADNASAPIAPVL